MSFCLPIASLSICVQTYLGLLHSYVQKLASLEHADLDPVHVLEEEWRFMGRLVPQVRQGMSHVGRRFWYVKFVIVIVMQRHDSCMYSKYSVNLHVVSD